MGPKNNQLYGFHFHRLNLPWNNASASYMNVVLSHKQLADRTPKPAYVINRCVAFVRAVTWICGVLLLSAYS